VYVIIGAGGNIGGTVARKLRARGAPVRAVVRDPARGAGLAAIGCELVIADINQAPGLADALTGADAVHAMIPIAPQAPDAAAAMRASVDSLVGALSSAPAPHVLAISDYGAELASGTGVTLTFHYLEARIRELPGAVTLVRSSEHMQNWRRQAPSALRTRRCGRGAVRVRLPGRGRPRTAAIAMGRRAAARRPRGELHRTRDRAVRRAQRRAH
jgi:NAD(P)H dehydrogenase (quinone)